MPTIPQFAQPKQRKQATIAHDGQEPKKGRRLEAENKKQEQERKKSGDRTHMQKKERIGNFGDETKDSD